MECLGIYILHAKYFSDVLYIHISVYLPFINEYFPKSLIKKTNPLHKTDFLFLYFIETEIHVAPEEEEVIQDPGLDLDRQDVARVAGNLYWYLSTGGHLTNSQIKSVVC